MRSGTVFVSLLNKTSSGGKGETRILARSLKRGCIGSCQDWIWFQVVKVYILTSEKGYCLFALFSYCSLSYKRRFSRTLNLAKTAFILRTVARFTKRPSAAMRARRNVCRSQAMRTGNSKKATQTQLLMRCENLIAVYVHFKRFIDLTIYSYTNLYNLASDRLLWRRVPKQVFRKVLEKPIKELNNGDGNKIVQKAVSFYAKQQRKSTSHSCWRHSTTTTWNFEIFHFMDDEVL